MTLPFLSFLDHHCFRSSSLPLIPLRSHGYWIHHLPRSLTFFFGDAYATLDRLLNISILTSPATNLLHLPSTPASPWTQTKWDFLARLYRAGPAAAFVLAPWVFRSVHATPEHRTADRPVSASTPRLVSAVTWPLTRLSPAEPSRDPILIGATLLFNSCLNFSYYQPHSKHQRHHRHHWGSLHWQVEEEEEGQKVSAVWSEARADYQSPFSFSSPSQVAKTP